MGTEGNEGMRVRGQGVIFFFFFYLSPEERKERSEWVEEERKKKPSHAIPFYHDLST